MATSAARLRRREDLNEVVGVIRDDTIHIVNQVKKKNLPPSDVISILFLLFGDFQWLIQLMFDSSFFLTDIMLEWAYRNPNCKEVLVEALSIIQQFKILRNLGLQNTSLIRHYSDHKCEVFYVPAINNKLYRLCENITTVNLEFMRNQLSGINIRANDTSEEILLKLIKEQLICVEPGNCDLEFLISILDNISDLQEFAAELKIFETALNKDHLSQCKVGNELCVNCGIQHIPTTYDNILCRLDGNGNQPTSNSEVKPGACSLLECYPIEDPTRPGVCIIINQENFYSTEADTAPPATRKGSNCDKQKLYDCMKMLNFKVFHTDDLCSKRMLEYIIDVIHNGMIHSDSIFMLCILSHGARGHIYGADSIKVNVETIQRKISQELQNRKFNIPKVMFIQACQVNEPGLSNSDELYSAYAEDFLICWAAVPGSIAPRLKLKDREIYMSFLFVDITTKNIKKYARHHHMLEISTVINSDLQTVSKKLLEAKQISMCQTTLTKCLFLQRIVS